MELVEVLDFAIEQCEKTIEQFKTNLDKHPTYAFQWADSAILASAQMDVYLRAKHILEYMKDNPEEDIDIYEEVKNDAVRELSYSLSDSTSASSRNVNTAKTQVASEILKGNNIVFGRKTSVRTFN